MRGPETCRGCYRIAGNEGKRGPREALSWHACPSFFPGNRMMSSPLESGRVLSHYRLIEKVGEGGMGVVWKAEDAVLGRTVAIKVLPADVSRDADRRSMFLNEARLASQVSHAHIVQVHEFGREGDLVFIVMEYVEGTPLNKILHGRPPPPDKVAGIGLQVARALSSAHRKGLLHRDLKPSNILVTGQGEVKVADFGLAILFDAPGSMTGSTASTSTLDDHARGGPADRASERRLVGTVPYMSPEQAMGDVLDARSDIFSLGIVLYEMTTGRRPFLGATNAEILGEITKAEARPVHELVPKVPLDLDRIVQKALAKNRSNRYQSTDDLAVDLKRLSQDLDSGSSPSYEDLKTASSRVGRRRAVWIAAGVVLAALAVLALPRVRGGFTPGHSVDDRTILVLPVAVRGQDEGADYVGLAFAQALAVNLAKAPALRIVPVPETPVEESARSAMANRFGAGRILTGMVVREPQAIRASLSLVDVRGNRIVWGTQSRVEGDDLSVAAVGLARAALAGMGETEPRLYEHIEELSPAGEMGRSLDLAEALGAFRRGDRPAAVEPTRRLVAAFPSNPEAWALRSYAALHVWFQGPSQERRADLEASLETLRRLDPDSPYLMLLRGYVSSADGQPRDAIEAFSHLLERSDLTPGFRSMALGLRADREGDIGDPAAAEHDLQKALRLDPTRARNLSRLSRLYRASGRYDEAIEAAQRVIALEPA